MRGIFPELNEFLLLLKGVHDVSWTIFHLINLEGKFDDVFDINLWFGVGIFIYYDFKSILISLTAWKILRVIIYDSFCRFDGCGRVE